ncbi:hypothetical protein A2U01_0099272 [Trifolium medium]|nr:hypothetical protein [Trifolium medium]
MARGATPPARSAVVRRKQHKINTYCAQLIPARSAAVRKQTATTQHTRRAAQLHLARSAGIRKFCNT